MFIETYKYWMDRATGENKIIFKVAVNTEEQKQEILQSIPDIDIHVLGNHIKGVPMASYCLTHDFEAEKDEDIVIWMSDDFYCPDKWDKIINDEYSFGYNGCVVYRDGIQGYLGPVTMPILTYHAFKMINKVLYNPIFHHSYSDNLLYSNLRDLNLMKDLRNESNIIFEHRHHSAGKRQRDEADAFVDGWFEHDHIIYDNIMKKSMKDRLTPSLCSDLTFSILISTTDKKKDKFDRLIKQLDTQYDDLAEGKKLLFEVVFLSDYIPEKDKRKELLLRARGEYVYFVDATDSLPDNFLHITFWRLESKPDTIDKRIYELVRLYE
jgi:hypothetical protein